ncbi:MAG: hypothetical protein IJ142_02740 [Bacteroidaceae bacterium]|nr:hypothetical protein [Bacteroidaceae bacterium]MBQ9190504.1 hypothetical protein [Bacteroidaceae bacterium]
MKKHLFIAAAALLALASCTTSEETFQGIDFAQEEAQNNAIQFGTYMGQQVMTRAGQTGSLNTDALKASANGFGVFAYYTGNQSYNDYTSYPASGPQTSKMANFMFNQQVKYESARKTGGYITAWTYSPMKYWPNEVQNGSVDDQDNDTGSDPATTAYGNGGNLSFFAYAPYVELSASALDASNGGIIKINGESTLTAANGKQTDPIITYVVPSAADKAVDLLWGTYNGTSSNVLGTGNAGVAFDATGTNYEKAILPHYTAADESTNDGYRLNADLTKQKTNGTVGFAFKHALAKVGGSEAYSSLTGTTHGLMVVADIDDQKGAEKGGALSSATRITITDVQITARALYDANGDNDPDDNEYLKTMQGDLNLATGQWNVLTTSNTGAVGEAATTTHNITSPASTGITSSAELNDVIAEPEPSSITTSWSTIPTGVITTPKNVYKSEAAPLVFIPGTYPELTITINYTVRSSDSKLADGAGKTDEGKWTYVKQVITKKVTFTNPVELNKQYSLLMHLGLTGVKFTATVSDWQVNGDDNGDGTITAPETLKQEDVNLPINVSTTMSLAPAFQTIAANATSAVAITASYSYYDTGTSAMKTDDVTSSATWSIDPSATIAGGNVSGISENKTSKNVTYTVTAENNGTKGTATIIQSAGAVSATASGSVTNASGGNVTVDVKDANSNNIDLSSTGNTYVLSIEDPSSNPVDISTWTVTPAATGLTIEVPNGQTVGTYTIKIQVNDAAETTTNYTVS